MMTAQKTIAWLTAILVFLLALGSFALSYHALRDYAGQHGVAGPLSYIWPLLIDASLIVFSLAVVNAYLQAESTWRQWSLVGIYTLATIGFNVLHAPDNLQAQIVAAIAPVSLFFSFELLMTQLKTTVKKHGLTLNIEQLNTQAKRLAVRVGQLTAQKDELESRISELQTLQNGVLNGNLNDANAKRIEGKRAALNALLKYVTAYPNASYSEIGGAINRSPSTVSGYVNELIESGRLHRNGNGLEVVTQ